jgi:hypothetical protein
MAVLACIFGGIALGIYPGWDLVLGWVVNSAGESSSVTASVVAMISAVAAAVSAFFSFQSLAHARNTKSDDILLEHATTTISRAYEVLMEGSNAGVPVKNRMNWLTSARLIEEFKGAKNRLVGAEVKRRCDGVEDYWRVRFRAALERYRRSGADFSDGQADLNAIYPISAVIVHAFSDWPEGKQDDLDKYPNASAAVDEVGLSRTWSELHIYVGTWNR